MRFARVSLIAVCSLLAFGSESADPRPADIVDVRSVDPTILVDLMYLSSMNFVGHPIVGYRSNVCYLTRAAGEKLRIAQTRLRAYGRRHGEELSLLMRDCYRPRKSVLFFVDWAKRPDEIEMKELYYPDLTKTELIDQDYISPVSGHSRASTFDLTIARKNSQGAFEAIPMGTRVDFMGPQSWTDYPNIGIVEKSNRRLLGDMLGPEFRNYPHEWWHYALRAEPYPKTFFDFDVD